MFVKICGITREEDALLATALGADAVGFVFAPSTRQVAVPIVRDIVRQLPADIMTVGVFRDESPKRVVEVVNGIGLRAAQLHGHETPRDCRWIAERIPVTIRALAAGSPDLERFDDFGAELLLLDSPLPGSGEVFDWALAEGAPDNRQMILAGGLDPTNVVSAIERVAPYGVDVSSGVESVPGRKDPRLLRAFVEAAHSAEPRAVPYESQRPRPFDWEAEE
ncbi:MAG: N-(5'-phosphoribosyl)anthranilate isomerase [Acidimicrobiaceae bacterium]|jgi:phosphoribosylanthranilate isomerase|nr:N-(5'-phosphoribosyl)anthranilate isomerase [Acidimicrobiaceae bacterium]MDP6481219.1 phosphoribosylanthranilate isomerase [Acidimicrobiales bacterium]MDP6697169.1 phosphoribosylanthranilate isomerase [Acidimicrobiales bacterium]|tara:strand:+ start:10496 stop:11158 length:663 start_codon:yes stop_codon:yes gene_type:complete